MPSTVPSYDAHHIGNASAWSLKFPNNVAGASASTLNYYENTTHTTALNGAFGTGTAISANSVQIVRDQDEVNLYVKGQSTGAATAATVTFATVLPSRFRPQVAVSAPIIVSVNGTDAAGRVDVGTDGSVTIYATAAGGNFTATQSGAFKGFRVQWHLSCA